MIHISVFIIFVIVPLCSQIGHSYIIEPKFWTFKGHPIGYEVAYPIRNKKNTKNVQTQQQPILLLNGFGVGSFHQHRLIPLLQNSSVRGSNQSSENNAGASVISNNDDDDGDSCRDVYGIDYLGQGRSWPKDCDDGDSKNERGLIYSADTWVDQIIAFIEEVILQDHEGIVGCESGEKNKIHLVGNSVGGYLSVMIALRRPDLVQSIVLLNGTPVWGLNLPFWSGRLPAPSIPRLIGRFLFDRIRSPRTIETYLDVAYANRAAFDDDLIRKIRECTEGPGGHAAFASIMWSPPASIPHAINGTTTNPLLHSSSSFYKNLEHVNCDVLLVFGKEDPWCKPAFAKRMLKHLHARGRVMGGTIKPQPRQRYVELSNVGHCPNHEAPEAVAKTVLRWIGRVDQHDGDDYENDRPLFESVERVLEPWGGDVFVREVSFPECEDMGFFDRITTNLVG